MQVNFNNIVRDYAHHRAGFPAALFDRLADHGIGGAGTRLLDLGTGTGSLALGFARRGATVSALDVAPEMLAEVAARAVADGLTVETVCAGAESTGLADGSFDAVVAGQCWHWFDRPRAAAEVRRLLNPGGRLAICHFDWIPLAGNVAAATERLIVQHNPAWNMGDGTGLYPDWLADAACAGFTDLQTFSFDIAVPYSHEAWCGRIRASAGVGGSLGALAVAAFDRDHAAMLARDFPADPLNVLHRVFAMIGTIPRD
ncbi:MAG: class I SAM-dependent methyltransferase [Alphaproteobacteria bacterium]